MRVVAWNIRAGGGRRALDIAAQLTRWQADVVVLSEFRATPPSRGIAAELYEAGLRYQRHTSDRDNLAINALLVVSRWPLRVVTLGGAPQDRHRWLQVNVSAPEPFAVLALHVPNRVTGRKLPFLDAVTEIVRRWRGPRAMLIGDTNSGRIGIDEESKAFDRHEDHWLQRLDSLGWRDAFRTLHPRRREFTWYSPNGNNGFRLDQAFVHCDLLAKLKTIRHDWGGRRGALSDHAALVLDFDKPGS